MSIKDVLRSAKQRFENRGIPTVDAELMLAHVLGVPRMQLHAKEFDLLPEQEELFTEMISQRISGTPTQYLTGEAPFRYLTFAVGPGVLIPRPETELLVDAALVEIERIQASPSYRLGTPTSVVDFGAGSGAIAISIAHEAAQRKMPVNVVAVEKSAPAVEWLKKNISQHEVDVRVINSDVATALEGVKCDIVVANPPYIPNETKLPALVADHEPAEALYGGSGDGMNVPALFIKAATRVLKSGGYLVLEHFEEQSAVLERELSPHYSEISHYQDLNNRPRWISARRK